MTPSTLKKKISLFVFPLFQVEVTHGEDKQVIALPSEKLDRTKRYYVTFTVHGDSSSNEIKPKVSPVANSDIQRNTKSV